MKKLQLTIKLKKFFTWTFLVLSVLFIVLLFAFKDTLNSYASKAIKAQAGSEVQNSESTFVDSAYNYAKNGLNYEVTFLEFGAKGCSVCKRMESVMNEIRTKYTNRVNVVFVNIMVPENHQLMKYYGIVAIPTQVFINRDGKEFFRHTGYYSTQEIIKNLIQN
jgi:thioredoxin 1